MDGDESAEELCTEALNDDDDCPNDHESWVREDTLKDINLIIDFSGANHVENLHENEEIEDDGEVSGWGDSFECLVHWLLSSILLHTE